MCGFQLDVRGKCPLRGRPVCNADAVGQAGSARTGGAVRLGSRRGVPRDDAHQHATAGRYDLGRTAADPFWPLPKPPPGDHVAGTGDYLRITQILGYGRNLTAVVMMVG